MPMMPDAASPALAAVKKANELAPHASPAERTYIGAMTKRYSADPKADRALLDKDFSAAMKSVAASQPDDPDAQVFYAESLMDKSPWDYWEPRGKNPHPGLEDIVPTLERVMKRWPNHPGALHLYIHAVEASANPKRGEVAADKLRHLMPGAGHIVHMPGHIYNRIGRYADALQVNLDAEAADEAFAEKSGQHGIYSKMYYIHNLQFGNAAAANDGQGAVAVAQARKALKNVDFSLDRAVPVVELVPPMVLATELRFGKFDDVLAEPAPDAKMHFSVAMYHYARACAFAAKNDLAGAAREQAAFRKFLNDPDFAKFKPFGVPVNEMMALADNLVAGDIARRGHRLNDAVASYGKAVTIYDKLPYTEPPYWDYPVRNTLGAALLEAGNAKEAEDAFRESLKQWPHNGWAEFGLMKALEAQHKTTDAVAAKSAFEKASARADYQPQLAQY
jgi:tetratricopeptide (TPR) repeat protein